MQEFLSVVLVTNQGDSAPLTSKYALIHTSTQGNLKSKIVMTRSVRKTEDAEPCSIS